LLLYDPPASQNQASSLQNLQTTADLLIKTGFGVLVGLFGGKVIE